MFQIIFINCIVAIKQLNTFQIFSKWTQKAWYYLIRDIVFIVQNIHHPIQNFFDQSFF